MKKITVLTGPLAGHGGEETVLQNFAQLLSDNFEVNLIVSEMVGNSQWIHKMESYFNKCVSNKGTNAFLKLVFIVKYLNIFESDLVICLTPRMTFFANLVKKVFFKNFKIVTWMQFSIKNKFDRQTSKLLLKADYHMALNSEIKNEYEKLGIEAKKICVVYNPIKRQKRHIDNSSEITRLLYIGRIQFKKEKNLNELFRGLAPFANLHNWQLDIYGADDSPNNEETKLCKKMISEFHLEQHIIWHGYYQQVWNQVASADCLLLTSTSEGFGMVLCEAISFGIPVISSDCPSGPRDIVNDNNGYLYPMGDIDSLTHLISTFIYNTDDFTYDTVKESISKMYTTQYKERLERFFLSI